MCELPKVFREEVRTARKEHHCCECGEKIRPGIKYVCSSGIWSDGADSFKQCLRCSKLMAALHNEDFAECIAFGQLYDVVREYWNEKNFPLDLLSGRDLLDKADQDIENMQNGSSAMNSHIECGDDGVWMGAHFEYWQWVNRKNPPVPQPYWLNYQAEQRRLAEERDGP